MRELVKRAGTLSFLLPLGMTLISVLYLIGCYQLSFGTFSLPEEGFVPTLFGFLLFGGSLLLTVDTFRREGKGASLTSEPKEKQVANIFLLIAVLFGYVVFLPILGFSICTFGAIVASAKIMQAGWKEAVALAMGTTAVAFLLFRLWLNVPLPSAAFF